MLRIVSSSLVALALLGGCSGDGGAEVAMAPGRRFDPTTIEVAVGSTVTWVSEGDEAHTVTAYEDSLGSGASFFSSGGFGSESDARDNVAEALIEPGGSYEVTFDQPGTYEYFCIPHEEAGMKGTVVVEG